MTTRDVHNHRLMDAGEQRSPVPQPVRSYVFTRATTQCADRGPTLRPTSAVMPEPAGEEQGSDNDQNTRHEDGSPVLNGAAHHPGEEKHGERQAEAEKTKRPTSHHVPVAHPQPLCVAENLRGDEGLLHCLRREVVAAVASLRDWWTDESAVGTGETHLVFLCRRYSTAASSSSHDASQGSMTRRVAQAGERPLRGYVRTP